SVQETASISVPVSSSNNTYSIPLDAKDTSEVPQHATTIALTVGADFKILALTPSLTGNAGQPAQFAFNVQPVNGTFNGSVSFSCMGAPHLGSCTFSPSSTTAPPNATATTMTTADPPPPSDHLRRPGRPFSFQFSSAFMLPLTGF